MSALVYNSPQTTSFPGESSAHPTKDHIATEQAWRTAVSSLDVSSCWPLHIGDLYKGATVGGVSRCVESWLCGNFITCMVHGSVDLPSAFVHCQMWECWWVWCTWNRFLTQRWWHSHSYSIYYRIFVPPLNLYHSSPMPRQQFSMCVCVHVCACVYAHVCVLGLLCYCWQLSRIYNTSLHCHPMAFQWQIVTARVIRCCTGYNTVLVNSEHTQVCAHVTAAHASSAASLPYEYLLYTWAIEYDIESKWQN